MANHRFDSRREGPYQSQHGEDLWLERYFRGQKAGFFVDVGAYDGVVISNTYFFESIGWTGVLVEPNPSKAVLCRQNRPASKVFQCAAVSNPDTKEVELLDVPDGEVYATVVPSDFNLQRIQSYGLTARKISVPARTLDSILSEVSPPRIDFISIDVEGGELEVLNGFDIARWKPRLVMLESPPRRRPEIRQYLTAHGYSYLRSINVNDIYRPLPPLGSAGAQRLVTSVVDGAWYATSKAAHALREKVRLRTRLRQRGWWP